MALLAAATAEPPSCSERDPEVPPPVSIRSVSPCTTSMSSIGMPSSAEASIDHAVAWPWPCGEVPVNTVARPSGRTSMRACSLPPVAAVTST